MNILIHNNATFKLESLWRNTKNELKYDVKKKLYPWPEKNTTHWYNQDHFIEKLSEVEKYLDKKHMYKMYKHKKSCKFNDAKNVSTKTYILHNIVWEDGLMHYIVKHNVKPSNEFIDFIFRYKIPNKKSYVSKIKGTYTIKYDKQYIKISRNQILILDALMEHGGVKKYVDKNHDVSFKYSEHSGLLDFNNFGLEKIIVSAKTSRVDKNDETIYLPQNMPDAFDYEFIFHTHPPTPKPGGRVKMGILYEFPSISDIFHFIDHYNHGDTQGSLIIASEGLYLIRKKNFDDLIIEINEKKMYLELDDIFWEVQHKAIDKYGTDFTKEVFYEEIAQNKTYIRTINNVLHKYKITIDYYPRVQDKKGKWIVDNVYLPIYVVEPYNKK